MPPPNSVNTRAQYVVEVSGIEIGTGLILIQGLFLAAFFSGIWLGEDDGPGSGFLVRESVAVLAGGILAFSAAYVSSTLRRAKGRRETVEERVRSLIQALEDAARMIDHIEEEVQARNRLAEKLKKDIDVNRRLANLRQGEVEAVAQALRGELSSAGRKSLAQSFLLNFLFFVLGFVVSQFSK